MKTILFHKEKEYIKKFVKLPQKLYCKRERTNDPKTEIQLLEGNHILSHYFEITGFLVLDERENTLSRCIVTIYPGDKMGYVGFFESINDVKASRQLFEAIEKFCKDRQLAGIMGPLDASFWIKYRLKTNYFERPYACEPYNKHYYFELFESAGFTVSEQYFSNHFHVVDKDYSNKKYEKRLQEMLENGYQIESLKVENFNSDIKKIYELINTLYRNFPGYKEITQEEFIEIFSSLKVVLNLDMVYMAYKGEEPVGFFITMPDYSNNICGSITLIKLIKILWKKKHPKEYVHLYLGVKEEHLGLGTALSEKILEKMRESQIPSIGALIHGKKVTGGYFKELVDKKYEYVLFYKNLQNIYNSK